MNSFDLNPSSEDLAAIRSGHQTPFSNLLNNWLPDIRSLSAGFSRTAFDRDDYVQVGSLTLFDACHTYPVEGAVAFERYARRAIKLAMIDVRRAERAKSRTLVAFVEPAELPDLETPFPGPLDCLVEEEDEAAVREWVGRLHGRDRQILKGVYWREIPQAQLARSLGLTSARVSQIHRALLAAGRQALQWSVN